MQVVEGTSTDSLTNAFTLGVNLAWGDDSAPRDLVDRPMAVLLQNAKGEVVDLFCANGASPAVLDTQVDLDPREWSGFPLSWGDPRMAFHRRGHTHQRTAEDWWQASPSPNVQDPFVILPFIGSIPGGTLPWTVPGFVNGVWKGEMFLADLAAFTRFVAQDDGGRLAVSDPIQIDSERRVRLLSFDVASLESRGIGLYTGSAFKVVVTNEGTVNADNLKLRVQMDPGLGVVFVGLGRAPGVPGISAESYTRLLLSLTSLPAGTAATIEVPFGTIPQYGNGPIEPGVAPDRSFRFSAELFSQQGDSDLLLIQRSRGLARAWAPPTDAWIAALGTTRSHHGIPTSGTGVTSVIDRGFVALRFDGLASELRAEPAANLHPAESGAYDVYVGLRPDPGTRSRQPLFESVKDGKTARMLLLHGRPAVEVGGKVYAPDQAVTPDLRDGGWHRVQWFRQTDGSWGCSIDGHLTFNLPLVATEDPATDPVPDGIRIGADSAGRRYAGKLGMLFVFANGMDPSTRQFWMETGVFSIPAMALSPLQWENNLPTKVYDSSPSILRVLLTNNSAVTSQPTALYIKNPTATNRIEWVYWNQERLEPVAVVGSWRVDLPGLPPGGVASLRVRIRALSTEVTTLFYPVNTDIVPFWIVGTPHTMAEFGSMMYVERYAYQEPDRDGPDDWWENRFGLSSWDWNDGNLDADGDGFPAFDEMLAYTDPRDPASRPLVGWSWSDSLGVTLRTPSNETWDYTFEMATAVDGTVGWQRIEVRPGTGSMLEFNHKPAPGSPSGYYRVVPRAHRVLAYP